MERFIQTNRRARRVLVVDDEAINRELLTAILSLNYEVHTASDGKEAMDMLSTAKEPYALVLLDLLMPNKSGFQLLQECKADDRFRDIPVIVMTSEKSAEVRSIRMGADDFISKPYRMPEVIIARCERIIELSEEKALIRSIEKDPVTGLYIKVFFDAYVRRLLPDIRCQMDAVVIDLCTADGQPPRDSLLQTAAKMVKKSLVIPSGIACNRGDGRLGVFCGRRNDYEALLSRLTEELSAMDEMHGVLPMMGIYNVPDRSDDTDEWFKKAEFACDSAPDGTVGYYSE